MPGLWPLPARLDQTQGHGSVTQVTMQGWGQALHGAGSEEGGALPRAALGKAESKDNVPRNQAELAPLLVEGFFH